MIGYTEQYGIPMYFNDGMVYLENGRTFVVSGSTLAMVEAAHWYENVFLLGMVFLFFSNGETSGIIVGLVVCLAAYFLEILIGNSFARMKWQVALNSSWLVALVLGGCNLFALIFIG